MGTVRAAVDMVSPTTVGKGRASAAVTRTARDHSSAKRQLVASKADLTVVPEVWIEQKLIPKLTSHPVSQRLFSGCSLASMCAGVELILGQRFCVLYLEMCTPSLIPPLPSGVQISKQNMH